MTGIYSFSVDRNLGALERASLSHNLARTMASIEYLILWYLSVVGAWGINVDTKEPIIRGLPEQFADRSQDFGYQAVMHMLTIPDETSVQEFASQARVVVGAPKGSASSLATGLVYECPIAPGKCELMTNNTGDLADSMLQDDQNLSSANGTEQKQGQLLGATMANSGDRFMVCAPLYTQIRGQALWYTGKCFHSDRSLKNFTSYVFCSTATESETAESVLECPAGLSLAGAEMSEGFLFGVPLFKDGFGNVAVYSNGMFDEREIGGNSIFLQQRGYQVTYGYITTTEREQYVTVEYGADIVRGRVIVIDPTAPTTRALVIPGPILRIGPNVLQGIRVRGIAVGFGYAIATARINDEKYDSVLISAPFTSEGYEVWEIGTVYVYTNNNGNLLSEDPLELVSSKAPFGRFGAAIANMGDINKDGYEDIAVSAPYEGNGVVYIYHSMADGSGLNLESVQRIEGNDLNTGALENLVGFGTVLSSGVDVDGNSYNDLLVGSFETQKVVVLRTRPIVNVASTLAIILRGDSNTLDLDDRQCGDNACFDVEVCFTVEPTGVEGDAFQGRTVAMNYTLELEAGRAAMGPSRRSFFQSTNTAVLEQSVDVLNNNTAQCQNYTVRIRRAVLDRENEFNVSLRAQGKISFVPQSDGNQPLSDLVTRPVVIYSPKAEVVSVETPRNCGNDRICNTQLSVEIMDVTNANDDSGETDTITVLVRVNNTGEDSFRTYLISTFNRNVFNLSAVISNGPSPDCSDAPNEDNSTKVSRRQCLIGNPMRSNTTILASVVFNRTENRDFTESNFTLTFNIRGGGEELNKADDSASTTVNVTRVADLQVARIEVTPDTTLTIDNTVMRPDTLTSVSQLGPSVSFNVIVFNDGPSTAPGARLMISWPLNISEPSDSYILYPTSLTVSPEGTCTMDYIDPADLLSQSRQQRQAGSEGAAIQGDVTLECNNNINCVPITCTFDRIPSKRRVHTVTINSSVDVKYFQTQPDMNVRIPIEATVTLYDSTRYGVINPANKDTDERTVTVLYTDSMPEVAPTTLPLWIILVIVACIVIFILLLGLTIVVLYCLGFFRRKKYGQHPSKATAVLETVPNEEEDTSTSGKPEESTEGKATEADEKAAEADEKAAEADEKAAEGDDHNEPDGIAKSTSLTSLDIPIEMKTPETDV